MEEKEFKKNGENVIKVEEREGLNLKSTSWAEKLEKFEGKL